MLYIRRKDNPLIIRSWGTADSGGLGDFDTAVYEEVLADGLPEGWQFEEPPIPLESRIQLLYKSLSLAQRVASAAIFKTCQLMLQLDDEAGAKDYIQESGLEDTIRVSLLSLFEATESNS